MLTRDFHILRLLMDYLHRQCLALFQEGESIPTDREEEGKGEV